MIEIFQPDFSKLDDVYFPDGEVFSDLAIAKKVNGELMKQTLDNAPVAKYVDMPQPANDEVRSFLHVPRSVQTPVQMRQYLDAMKVNLKSEQEKSFNSRLNKSLTKFLIDDGG